MLNFDEQGLVLGLEHQQRRQGTLLRNDWIGGAFISLLMLGYGEILCELFLLRSLRSFLFIILLSFVFIDECMNGGLQLK